MKTPKTKEFTLNLDDVHNVEFDCDVSDPEEFPDFLDANVIYAEVYDTDFNSRKCKPKELDFINQHREFVSELLMKQRY